MKLNLILLEEYRDEMKTTRKFLESISEDLFEFSPHEKSKSFRELVNHMVPISSWIPVITKNACLLYTSPSPRDLSTSRMPSSA